jgi:bifunctional non-homologous end joining protein LigD
MLDDANIPVYAKTSGKTGMHLMIPLNARYTYLKARTFAKLIVERAHTSIPELTTLEQRLNKRKGKIYLDIARNAKGQTTASVYSLRPYPGATVSTPLHWREIKKGLSPSRFTIENTLARLKKQGDLFKPVLKGGIDLAEAMCALKN